MADIVKEKSKYEIAKSTIILVLIVVAAGIAKKKGHTDHQNLFRLGLYGVLVYIALTLFIDGLFLGVSGAFDRLEEGTEEAQLIKTSALLNFVIGVFLVIFLISLVWADFKELKTIVINPDNGDMLRAFGFKRGVGRPKK